MKFNLKNRKTLTILFVSLFAVALATAGIIHYYSSLEQDVSVEQPIKVNGEEQFTKTFEKEVMAGESYLGNFMKVTNNADDSRNVILNSSFSDELDVKNYQLETLEDSNNKEMVWGDGLKDLDDKLKVSVLYDDNMVVLSSVAPDDYEYGDDQFTYTIDKNEDGQADFQIQYNPEENKEWKYKEVVDNSWESEWSELPKEIEVTKDEHEFTMKLPISFLGGVDSGYKFGVDANGENSGNGQTFYSTNPEKLWYNGDDYVSSDNYVEMDIGSQISDSLEISGNDTVYFIDKIAVDNMAESGEYTVMTELLPA